MVFYCSLRLAPRCLASTLVIFDYGSEEVDDSVYNINMYAHVATCMRGRCAIDTDYSCVKVWNAQ